jgi:type I restriction enzyme S subunit
MSERADSTSQPVALEHIESWTGALLDSNAEFEGAGIRFAPGDVLYGKLRPYLAKAYAATFAGEAVGDFHVLRPHGGLKSRYLAYLLLTREVVSLLNGSTYGAKMPRVSWDHLGGLLIPLPSAREQATIVQFLDRETAKIDALVEEQRRLIELLKEKRQAVISHAVTKGLDPTAPMKDSGVEWLGEVPTHWEVMPLKRDLEFLTSGSRGWADHYADEGALFIRIGNLTRNSIDLDLSDIQRVAVPPGAEGDRTRVRGGDVLFSITAYLGSVAVIPEGLETAYVSQHVALARLLGHRLMPRWAAWVASSVIGRTYLDMQGYGGTKVQLALDDVAGVLMTVPPIDEQRLILNEMEPVVERLDRLASEAERTISLLAERRAALISAAVTGKIDVRDTAAAQAALEPA